MEFYFSGKGRVSRRQIWMRLYIPAALSGAVARALDAIVLSDVNAMLFGPSDGSVAGVIESIVMLFWIWPTLAIVAKRFHDRSKSGYWALTVVLYTVTLPIAIVAGQAVYYAFVYGDPWPAVLPYGTTANMALCIGFPTLVAALAVWLFVSLFFLRGHEGPNKYGPDPLNPDL
jgi:uncharacterized membrane protein YhaH (DUF805 family)